jgi:lipopolysaccharide transport system ATP-binding protein
MCGSALLLVEGRCAAQGNTPDVMQEYLRDISRVSVTPLGERTDRSGSGKVRFLSVSLEGHSGSNVSAFQCGAEAILHLVAENRTKGELRGFHISLGIDNEMGQRVALLDSMLVGTDISGLPPGHGSVRVVIPKMALIPGRYRLTLHATVNGIIADWINNAAIFDVEAGDYYGTGHLPPQGPGQGVFVLDHRFVVRGRRSEFEFAGAASSARLPQKC